MSGRDIIVIGGSAGGVSALPQLVAGLPSDLPARVLTQTENGGRMRQKRRKASKAQHP
jgi:chemotaxis response regulator CheB